MSDDLNPREPSQTLGIGADLPSLDDLPPAPGGSGAGFGAGFGPGMSGSGSRPSASLAAGLTPSGLGFDLRALGRKLGRVALWGGALVLVFIISAWVSLPTRSIAWRISHEARKAGFNITVDDLSIRPWGSATLEGVVWSFKPSRPDSSPVPFVIEELDVNFSVLGYLLFDELDVEFEATMDEGTMSGAYFQGDDESHVAFDIADLPLYGVPKLQESVNAPVRGVFALSVDITAPNNEWAKSSGRLEVHCYSCTVGDGETKLFVPGSKSTSMLSKGVTIPEIDLGTLDGVLEIVDGHAVAEEFGTESNDIVFKISGDIQFEDPIANSRLNLLIKVFIDPSLRERSDNVDLLVLTASPKVLMDPPDDGWMGLVLEGNFKHRRFRGIKSKSRQEQLREKREARQNRSKTRAEQRAQQRNAKQQQAEEAAAAIEAATGDEELEMPPPDERTIPPEMGVMLETAEVAEEADEAGEEGGEGEAGSEAGEAGEEGGEAAEETGNEGAGEEDPPQEMTEEQLEEQPDGEQLPQ
jgi:type II secretion system protein N